MRLSFRLLAVIFLLLFSHVSCAYRYRKVCDCGGDDRDDSSTQADETSGCLCEVEARDKDFGNRDKKMPGLLHDVDTAFKKATFGMGCFWAAESLYGAQKGVLRTRVGYAGGTSEKPNYKKIGDHTEVVEIDYDPKTISYDKLLQLFWNNHEYGLTRQQKKQYMSLILFHDEEQKNIAIESKTLEASRHKEPMRTEINKMGEFYAAEDYHQKYRLQEHTFLVDAMGITPQQLQTSHVACRLNGYVVGLGGMEQFDKEVKSLGLSDKMADYVRELLRKNKGGNLSC